MNELQHHGVKGMKWGVRKKRPYMVRRVRDHAGPGVRIGSTERKLAGAKQDLARLDRGEHLSIGSTKKRQAQYDARDRKALNEQIAKLEAKKAYKADLKIARTRDGMKKLYKMTPNGPEKAYFIGKKEVGEKYYRKVRRRVLGGTLVATYAAVGATALAVALVPGK